MKQREGNNKGLSFIELMVVLAIMMVMIGLLGAGFGLIGKGNSKRATKILASALSETRNDTLSTQDTWSARIYYTNGQYVVDILKKGIDAADVETVANSYKLGSRIGIAYAEYSISGSDNVVVQFAPRTGVVQSVAYNGSDVMAGTIKGEFSITANGGTDSNTLTLWYKTGKVETDY